MNKVTVEKENKTEKNWAKRRRMITSPILIGAATIVGINKVRQSNRLNKYVEKAKENTTHIKRAIILGDSVAKGYGSTDGGITNYLQEHLEQKYGEVIITNEGILHLTSEGLLEKLVQEKAYDDQLKESNLVFINIGGNDILEYFHKDGARAVFKNFFKIRSGYIKNLEKIVEYIESLNPNITIIVNNLYNSLEDNYQFFGLTDMFLNYWNASLNNLPVIRVNTKQLGRREELWADMVHPNQAGYKELSNLIIQQVNMILK